MMQDIANLLFHDKFQKRQKWIHLFDDEIWIPRFQAPLKSHQQQAYLQLKAIAKSKLVSVKDFINDPTNIFTAHEMIATVSPSTTTKFTVHYNLFGGTLLTLHTNQHHQIFTQLDNLQITGCFCLTQLGYGNNAVQMQTTSTYDPITKQFTINTPTILSQKYWITNGAIHANMALVFAQTIVKGKNQGINAFLVPIRDHNLKVLPGIQIRNMGLKIGLNGVDNAALLFHNIRIPRTNMLNKYNNITQTGQFTSTISGIQQRFFKVTQRLLSGRLCIASMALGALKRMIYTTIKYSQHRMGVSPNGKSQTPIFSYQLQKNSLIPIIARMLALNMLHNFAKQVYANKSKYEDQLIIICCVDKTLMGWHAERSIAVMRERCGGQGFLSANCFGQAIAGSHAALTAQGDNRVLMIKVAKDMLTLFTKTPQHFYHGPDIKLTKFQQLHNLSTICNLFEYINKQLLIKLITKILQLKNNNISNYNIFMFYISDQIQNISQFYGQLLALKQCIKSFNKLYQGKNILQVYYKLYAWEIIIRNGVKFITNKWIQVQIFNSIYQQYNALIQIAAKSVDHIIESFNLPYQANYSPIANDYVLYNKENYQGEVFRAKM